MVVCQACSAFVSHWACPHREMKMCPGVGGRILPGRCPHAVGVGDPAHGVQGPQSLAWVWGISLGRGGGSSTQGGDTAPHLLTLRGGVGWGE